MAGSREKAEDLTQEVFLKLFRKVSTFRGESRFSTWLHRLAVNEVLMYLRRKRLDTVSLDGVDASQEDPQKAEYRREYGNDDLRRQESRIGSA
jgi:RNA polymerase sigma-70 factor, ECF subfamily